MAEHTSYSIQYVCTVHLSRGWICKHVENIQWWSNQSRRRLKILTGKATVVFVEFHQKAVSGRIWIIARYKDLQYSTVYSCIYLKLTLYKDKKFAFRLGALDIFVGASAYELISYLTRGFTYEYLSLKYIHTYVNTYIGNYIYTYKGLREYT